MSNKLNLNVYFDRCSPLIVCCILAGHLCSAVLILQLTCDFLWYVTPMICIVYYTNPWSHSVFLVKTSTNNPTKYPIHGVYSYSTCMVPFLILFFQSHNTVELFQSPRQCIQHQRTIQ